MAYTLLQLNTLPTILFAHTHETESYHNQRIKTDSSVEISYYEAGIIERKEGDRVKTIVPGSSSVSLPGDERSQKCISGLHRHITMAFDAETDHAPITEDEIAEKYHLSERSGTPALGEKSFFLLPGIIPPGKNAEAVHRSLTNIKKTYIETDVFLRSAACSGLILMLLSEITSFCLRDILSERFGSAGRPSDLIYMKAFYRYVNAHINEEISCAAIAESMGITQGYLSKIVADETGMPPKAKINFIKLNKIIDLCRTQGLSFSEAGRIFGFEDAHYLSRLFKNYYGMSYTEFTKNKV